jgi:hypothetical protein
MKPEKIKPVSVSTTTTLGEFADTANTPNDDVVILRWGTEPTAIVNSTLIYDVSTTDS